MAESSKFSYHVDHDLHRLATTCVGTLLLDDVTGHFQQRETIGAMEYEQLVDLRMARVTVTTAQVERLATLTLRQAAKYHLERTAFVVNDDVSFGMIRMFGTMVSPEYNVNVFRSHTEAREWLGWTRSRTPGATRFRETRSPAPLRERPYH